MENKIKINYKKYFLENIFQLNKNFQKYINYWGLGIGDY